MKRTGFFSAFLLVVVVGLFSACQPAQDSAPIVTNVNSSPEVVDTAAIETELKRIENDWPRVIREKDVAAVRRVEADDVVIIYPDGSTGNKEQDLKDIEAGNLTAEKVEMTDLTVTVLDKDAAVVTGRTIVTKGQYKMPDGKTIDISGQYRFADTFARRNGEWKLVAGASVPVRQPPTASPSPTASPKASPAASPTARTTPATRPSPAAAASPAATP